MDNASSALASFCTWLSSRHGLIFIDHGLWTMDNASSALASLCTWLSGRPEVIVIDHGLWAMGCGL
jgi:hypothetical protein